MSTFSRRQALAAAALPWSLPAWAGAARDEAAAGGGAGTLRVAFNNVETGFDPQVVGDEASILVCEHIFESPLGFDMMASPARLVPRTAVALPEHSADFRHWVFTLRPGIFFADDPVFRGQPRELVAEDYVYAIKRLYDPKLRSEHLHHFENAKLLGLSELRAKVLKDKTPFPYDVPVAGLRAMDRYRFEVRLAEPAPRLPFVFTASSFCGAVAREVIEGYDDPMAHPVGTGPFRLASWRRGSRVVLERNPRFRTLRAGVELPLSPPEGDAALQALAQRLQGRALPLLQRIEVAVITESQPAFLAFLGG